MNRKKIILFITTTGMLFYLISWSWNEWLSETMPRHQVIQLPAMFLLGVIIDVFLPRPQRPDTSSGIAILVFVMASLIFWMLPRSVDMAVLNDSINRGMHINMLVAGFLTAFVLRTMIFEIKILFLGMTAAMLLVVGFTLRVFDMLLCSSFTIPQQRETGLYLIMIGAGLFISNVIIFFAGLIRPKESMESGD